MEQQYRDSEEYHEAWRMKARDLLAKSEFRKRKITKRVSHFRSDQRELLSVGWQLRLRDPRGCSAIVRGPALEGGSWCSVPAQLQAA